MESIQDSSSSKEGNEVSAESPEEVGQPTPPTSEEKMVTFSSEEQPGADTSASSSPMVSQEELRQENKRLRLEIQKLREQIKSHLLELKGLKQIVTNAERADKGRGEVSANKSDGALGPPLFSSHTGGPMVNEEDPGKMEEESEAHEAESAMALQNEAVMEDREGEDMAKRHHQHANSSSQVFSCLTYDQGNTDQRNVNTACQVQDRESESPRQRRGSSNSESRESQTVSAGAEREWEEKKESTVVLGSGRGAPAMKECAGISEMKPKHRMSLRPLCYSHSQTVLIDVNAFKAKKELKPQEGRDHWHGAFVKMPCSEHSMYTKKSMIMSDSVRRWESIKKKLSRLSKEPSVTDVEEAIKKYNPAYKDEWSFDALHEFYKAKDKRDCSRTLGKIAELAVSLPDVCRMAIPLLRQGHNHSITLSQKQIACLLANAFYCTFPNRNTTKQHSEYSNYPDINFSRLFGQYSERKHQKLQTLFHYFRTVTEACPRGLVTFERRHLTEQISWQHCNDTISKLHVQSDGTIETEGEGMLQVDFACNLVGGGVLGNGLVQEEIRFLINPELIVARLFTEKLGDRDCLRITGAQRYSCYTGYSDSYRWTAPYIDNTERDEWMRLRTEIVAIDALKFQNPSEQFNMGSVTRELNKAYCGFYEDCGTHPDYYTPIATGNWGCGAFHGDPRLKALIQIMAASKAKRGIVYFTCKDHALEKEIREMHCFLTKQRVTVGRLYGVLTLYCQKYSQGERQSLYDFVYNKIMGTASKH
nr:PREDICTED: poly(ADP-ribose) glycohydrolase-like isoform X2 [Lepisosteus oculatus]